MLRRLISVRPISLIRSKIFFSYNRHRSIQAYESGKNLPQKYYTSPKLFEKDLKLIWRKSWLFAGLECQIPNVGDYFCYNIGARNQDSIVITRGSDNTLKAYHNVCAHRGLRLVTGNSSSTNRRTFVCPYHNWCYN